MRRELQPLMTRAEQFIGVAILACNGYLLQMSQVHVCYAASQGAAESAKFNEFDRRQVASDTERPFKARVQ